MRVDRPIIFSAPMIRALLDGRKTMTRRLAWRTFKARDGAYAGVADERALSPWQRVRPGDRLWVREAWSLDGAFADRSGAWLRSFDPEGEYLIDHLKRRADGDSYDESTQAWRPSIHMPRWASRLTLTVTATKIERLQAIDGHDAMAEGAHPLNLEIPHRLHPSHRAEAIVYFKALWESLHGPGSWDANPEVVALTFTVEKRNIDAGDWRDVPSDTEPMERA